jgi:hypothetical protein
MTLAKVNRSTCTVRSFRSCPRLIQAAFSDAGVIFLLVQVLWCERSQVALC